MKVVQSCLTLCNPMESMEFSRPEYQSGQPFPSPGDLPNPAIEPRRHHFVDRSLYSQSYGFSSSPAGIWELDHKEGWAPKSWCFQTVVLEETLESPLDCKEIKPIVREINIHWKDWCWSWNSDTLVTRFEELTHWKSLQLTVSLYTWYTCCCMICHLRHGQDHSRECSWVFHLSFFPDTQHIGPEKGKESRPPGWLGLLYVY